MAKGADDFVITQDNAREIFIAEVGGGELYASFQSWQRHSIVDISESKGQTVLYLIIEKPKMLSCDN